MFSSLVGTREEKRAHRILLFTYSINEYNYTLEFQIIQFNCRFVYSTHIIQHTRYYKLFQTKPCTAITTITIYAHFFDKEITVRRFIRLYQVGCVCMSCISAKEVNLYLL